MPSPESSFRRSTSAFRTINARWARTLGGASTGGWESAAQMIFYPDLYSGAWMFAPDPLDFHGLELVDIYDDPNAYFIGDPSSRISQIPAYRDSTTGVMSSRWNRRTTGSSRSAPAPAPAWASGTSVTRRTAPRARAGLSVPIWNKKTGVIDHRVAGRGGLGSRRLPAEALDDRRSPGRRQDVLLLRHLTTSSTRTPRSSSRQQDGDVQRSEADFTFEYGEGVGHPWLPMTLDELLTAHGGVHGRPGARGHRRERLDRRGEVAGTVSGRRAHTEPSALSRADVGGPCKARPRDRHKRLNQALSGRRP